jgi:hypothetical protein
MPNPSKKGPDEAKNYNISLEGRLHQRLKAMARAHRRSLRQEILTCLENCLARWDLENKVSRQAARDRTGEDSSAAPATGPPVRHKPRR